MDDVQRVLRRDFVPADEPVAARLLAEYARATSAATPRTMLAALKLANGTIAGLKNGIRMALVDYRDILMVAEYPRDSKVRWTAPMSEEERQKIYDEDWKEYEEWLNRP